MPWQSAKWHIWCRCYDFTGLLCGVFWKLSLLTKVTVSGKSYQILRSISYNMKRNIYFCHKANVFDYGGTCPFLTRKRSPNFSCFLFLFTIRSDRGNMRVTFDKAGFHRTLIHLPTAVLLLERSYFISHTDIRISNWNARYNIVTWY